MNSVLGRRDFLRIGTAAGGGLLIAIALPRALRGWSDGAAADGSSPPTPLRFNAFLAIEPGGDIVVTIPVPEIGQGVRTSLAMLIAEELEADWSRVRVIQGDAADDLGPHPFAGGSNAVRAYWRPLREAGAAARAALVAAAARRWNVDPADCAARRGEIRHAGSRRRLGFGDVAADAASHPLPDVPPLKQPGDFTIIGSATRGIDVPAIVRGAIRFGVDTRVPGMLHAVVLRAPVHGGRLRTWDDAEARRVPGVRDIVRVDSVGAPERPTVPEGLAVVAESTWGAIEGRRALRAEWDDGPNAGESSAALHAACEEAIARRAPTFREAGNLDAALRGAATRVSATYRVPFLAHAPMEPMSCVMHLRDDACEIWAPTQMPLPTRATVASRLGMPRDAVIVHVMRMGGGFGRRLSVDFILEAIPIARAMRVPVQVMWTREDDLRHGFLRPYSHHRLEAGLDAQGRVTGWLHRQAGTSRYAFRAGEEPGLSEFRAGTWPAALAPAHRLEYALVASNLPRGPLRAPGLNAFTFAVESFLDEIAGAAGRDPLDLRLELLAGDRELPYEEDHPIFSTARMRRVLETAADRAGWGRALPEGHGRGMAATFTFGSYVAHVIEVAVADDGSVRVQRVSSAIDCGRAVNPSGVRAQVEGGVMDGLGAALHGEITVEGGRVQQSNFHDFPLLRFAEAPRVDVEIIPSEVDPTGAGEPPYPPVPAALANAIHAASGARVRDLPLRADRVQAARRARR